MKSLYLLACLSIAISACGDDKAEDETMQDADAGAGGAAGASADPGAAGMTMDPPACDPTGEGACQNEQDCAVIVDGSATKAGKSCGLNCVADENRKDCVTSCFVETAHTSVECSTCYGALLDCVIENCFSVCATASDSQECVDCRDENGCDPEFRSCTGAPE